MTPYRLVERAPTPEEYRRLCAAVGWEDMINFNAATASLKNTVFSVVALYGEQAIGMGRITGDGAIYFYLQDIAVCPEHQGKGLGSLIVGRLMDYLCTNAPDKAFVGVFAAEGKMGFYARQGFMLHRALTGMFQVLERR